MTVVVVKKGSVDVLELLSQIDRWCLFLHITHVFELRASAARCFGLVNFFFLCGHFARPAAKMP